MTTRFPNLLVAGVPKAGTSSLFTWLDDHPQAQGSKEKETCFFADPDSHTFRPEFNVGQGLDRYKNAFPVILPESEVVFEATPTYIYSRTALEMVPNLSGAPKCIFVLREPASQIESVFRYFRDNWNYIPADMQFAQYLAAVSSQTDGFGGNELAQQPFTYADYGPWLHAWRAQLGPSRMMVCTFDQLRADPKSLMKDIAAWCGLDPIFYDDYGFPAENETYTPKNRLLQSINIAVRGVLPKGRAYQAARRLYRGLNTQAPGGTDNDAILTELRQQFAEANRTLAIDFDLDLSGWAP
jgi:hypothetical protein